MDIKKRLKSIPDAAGVYIMKDSNSDILYVGKATSLNKRITSYFYRKKDLEPKIQIMLGRLSTIDIKECNSEAEALILESELIKKLHPKYNTIGKDDKSFPWVKITKEDFPRVLFTRPKTGEDAILIGPFTSSCTLKSVLKTIRNIFPFRTCSQMHKKPCLNYSLGLCPAPCIFKISKKDYQRHIRRIRQILEGKTRTILKDLSVRMHTLSQKQRFEEAGLIRDQIQALESLWKNEPQLGKINVLWQLKSALALKRLPLRIEGFDISNISGDYNVGSLVSFYKTQPDKSQYRRYRVKTVSGANDYESILEIVRRRFSRIKEDNLKRPDLFIVDGGKGQVSALKKALIEQGLDIAVIGIAKRKEHIFMPGKKEFLVLNPHSPALHLIQQVRNEAHRFALKYHRLLRKKNMLKSKIKDEK
ncbi:MAG: excinuclease ABC subunit UvrC [Candidatus Omnitrophica bacterium]|nr:excinuclease ABC subunit UvrC [Candidatus Omnitrophota bacterium]